MRRPEWEPRGDSRGHRTDLERFQVLADARTKFIRPIGPTDAGALRKGDLHRRPGHPAHRFLGSPLVDDAPCYRADESMWYQPSGRTHWNAFAPSS